MTKPGMQMDRYAPFREIARSNDLDAVALVPGPNFHRLYGKNFHTNERPLVIMIPAEGVPAAVVPNLELGSFALIDFEGAVFDWRDQDGYAAAFDALGAAMPLGRVGVEGQIMRVFVHHALRAGMPGVELVDAERAISGLRLRKTPEEIAAMERAIAVSEAALARTVAEVRVGMTEVEVERLLTRELFAAGAEDFAFHPIVAAGRQFGAAACQGAGGVRDPGGRRAPDRFRGAGGRVVFGRDADVFRGRAVGRGARGVCGGAGGEHGGARGDAAGRHGA